MKIDPADRLDWTIQKPTLTDREPPSIRYRMVARKSQADWLKAARLALLTGGADAVRAERLAADLGVSKGSFYWHFKDVPALREALIAEWEDEADLLIVALGDPGGAGPQRLVDALSERVVLSERGEAPSDAAIFAWAAIDPGIAARVAVAERDRIDLLARLCDGRDRAELVYMTYLGFILRRRRQPDADGSFRILAAFLNDTFAADAPHPASNP